MAAEWLAALIKNAEATETLLAGQTENSISSQEIRRARIVGQGHESIVQRNARKTLSGAFPSSPRCSAITVDGLSLQWYN
jgi:hypothetical protein